MSKDLDKAVDALKQLESMVSGLTKCAKEFKEEAQKPKVELSDEVIEGWVMDDDGDYVNLRSFGLIAYNPKNKAVTGYFLQTEKHIDIRRFDDESKARAFIKSLIENL